MRVRCPRQLAGNRVSIFRRISCGDPNSLALTPDGKLGFALFVGPDNVETKLFSFSVADSNVAAVVDITSESHGWRRSLLSFDTLTGEIIGNQFIGGNNATIIQLLESQQVLSVTDGTNKLSLTDMNTGPTIENVKVRGSSTT